MFCEYCDRAAPLERAPALDSTADLTEGYKCPDCGAECHASILGMRPDWVAPAPEAIYNAKRRQRGQ